MAKYHESGTICEAKTRACPLGAHEHIEAASKEYFEQKLASRYAPKSKLKKTSAEVLKMNPHAAKAPKTSPFSYDASRGLPSGTVYGVTKSGGVTYAIPAVSGGFHVAVAQPHNDKELIYLTKQPRATPESALRSSDANPIVGAWSDLST